MMINSKTYGSLTPQRVKEIIAEKTKEASTDV
jgi:NADH:ubiquinone oxidoreductase subunit E